MGYTPSGSYHGGVGVVDVLHNNIISSDNSRGVDGHSSLYQEFMAEREEILKHKWIESEKAGHDIGFEPALVDWITKHRSKWVRARKLAEYYGKDVHTRVGNEISDRVVCSCLVDR